MVHFTVELIFNLDSIFNSFVKDLTPKTDRFSCLCVKTMWKKIDENVFFYIYNIRRSSSVVVIILARRVGGSCSIPTQCYDSLGK